MMKIKCDYCDSVYEDTLSNCPNCGATNPTQKGVKDGTPKTIEELKAWYAARGLPPYETTRFFIGVDYQLPRAFGVYQDLSGNFVVYKNKGDGSRAERYSGKDEAYAVNELYQKLKDEIVNQKTHQGGASTRSASGGRKKSNKPFLLGFAVIAVIWVAGIVSSLFSSRHNGYYSYHGTPYYHYQSHWYMYDDYWADWTEVYDNDATNAIESDYDSYFDSRSWDSSLGVSNWDDSSYYEEFHSDSDSSYDWDSSDSWDSGGTDWDSDW